MLWQVITNGSHAVHREILSCLHTYISHWLLLINGLSLMFL